MYIVLEVDIPTLIENIATNTDARFENSMIEVRNDLKENPESDFFNLFSDIFRLPAIAPDHFLSIFLPAGRNFSSRPGRPG